MKTILFLLLLVIAIAVVVNGKDGDKDLKTVLTKDGDSADKCGTNKCGEASFAHNYSCCSNESECCFRLRLWVYIVAGTLLMIIVFMTIYCCCCRKKGG